MSSLACKQTTTHPNGHDEREVCEGGQIKIPLWLLDDPEKIAVLSDYCDYMSKLVASWTRQKTRLDRDDDSAVDGYAGWNICSETDVPAVNETVRDGQATVFLFILYILYYNVIVIYTYFCCVIFSFFIVCNWLVRMLIEWPR